MTIIEQPINPPDAHDLCPECGMRSPGGNLCRSCIEEYYADEDDTYIQ